MSLYGFGNLLTINNISYFCISEGTKSPPPNDADWVVVNSISCDFPKSPNQNEVFFNTSDKTCYIYKVGWEPIFLESDNIVIGTEDPSDLDRSAFWINEIEETIFKRQKNGWVQKNEIGSTIIYASRRPSHKDDNCDTNGVGVVHEGDIWVYEDKNEVYKNIDDSCGRAIWLKL